MAARTPDLLPPGRILATGIGAFLVLYVLTAVWVVVRSDTESAASDADQSPTTTSVPPKASEPAPTSSTSPPAEVEISFDGGSITLTGQVGSSDDSEAVVRTVLDHTDVPLIINQLEINPAIVDSADLDRVESELELVMEAGAG